MFIFKDAEQIDIVKDDIFRIDGKIDFFLLDNTALIYNISILEKFNDFKDIVQRSARNSLQQIADAFLHSELSSNDYLSPGKDILRPEEVPDAQ